MLFLLVGLEECSRNYPMIEKLNTLFIVYNNNTKNEIRRTKSLSLTVIQFFMTYIILLEGDFNFTHFKIKITMIASFVIE